MTHISSTATPTCNITIPSGGYYNHSSCIPNTITIGSGISSNCVTGSYSYGAGSTLNWATPSSTTFSDGASALLTIPSGEKTLQVEKDATLKVNGNVIINGEDLEERLGRIETFLQIPTRDVTMEAKHPKLAELYKQYMHELEKYKTWDRLNGELE